MLTPIGAPWWIAVYIIGLCAISLLAFLAAPESKDVDITRAEAPW
jgi:MHS family shikimate/dehydroshikimate transporter-like MFS transporter